ncbi:MAG: HAD family hydrolase [Phycisphaerales bacterium]|nr:MAG: HAD family hydrolase [Phycisphaerales bacterium]
MATRAIIFDLDDTLYPERSYVLSGFDAVAAAFTGRLNPPFDLVRRMRQLSESPQRRRVFNVVCAEAGVADPEACAAEMVHAYRNHRPAISLFPDADAALRRYRRRYRLGLISDGYLAAQNAKLDALGIRDCFDAIILTDQWGPEFWKPHPRAFHAVMDQFELAPWALMYVSDNPAKDFVAPNRLGWQTVCVKRPGGVYAGESPSAGGRPASTISTLDQLDGVLGPSAS